MSEFITITTIIVLGAISPGPDFVLVSRNSFIYSHRVGVMTALGIAVASLVHATYCILGYAAILSSSPMLFSAIKYTGAVYLIGLGIKNFSYQLLPSYANYSKSEVDVISSHQAFMQGFICSFFNIYTVFFFIALFTGFVKTSTTTGLQITYGLEIALVAFAWLSLVSLMFSNNQMKLHLGRSMNYLAKLFGGLLIYYGIKIMAS